MMHSQHYHTATCKDPHAQEGMMLGMTRLSVDTLGRSLQPAKRKAAWTLSLRMHMGQGCPTRYSSNTGAAVCIACVTDAAAAQPASLARQHHGSGDARHDAVRKKPSSPHNGHASSPRNDQATKRLCQQQRHPLDASSSAAPASGASASSQLTAWSCGAAPVPRHERQAAACTQAS